MEEVADRLPTSSKVDMKYKIGDRVLTSIEKEATVIATDDRKDEFAMVKIRYDGFWGRTEWYYESMLNRIITNPPTE